MCFPACYNCSGSEKHIWSRYIWSTSPAPSPFLCFPMRSGLSRHHLHDARDQSKARAKCMRQNSRGGDARSPAPDVSLHRSPSGFMPLAWCGHGPSVLSHSTFIPSPRAGAVFEQRTRCCPCTMLLNKYMNSPPPPPPPPIFMHVSH